MNEGDTAVSTPTPLPPDPIHSHTFLPLIAKSDGFTPHLNAIFIGWSLPGPDGTWSTCPTADLIIGPVPDATASEPLTLTIQARGHGVQPVTVAINGELIGQMTFTDSVTAEHLTFSGAQLHADQNNHIVLHIPQASAPPASPDQRLLGIYLEKWVIDE